MDDNVLFMLEADSTGAVSSLEEIGGALDTLAAQLDAVGASVGELDPLEATLAELAGMSSGADDALAARRLRDDRRAIPRR